MVLDASRIYLALLFFSCVPVTLTLESEKSRTRLRSTAYGIPGQDAIYDYVGER